MKQAKKNLPSLSMGKADFVQLSPETSNDFFNLSLDLLCISGLDGYFKELNPSWSRVLGWTLQELKSRPFIEFIHPQDREKSLEAVNRLGTGTSLINFENRFYCKDGTLKPLSWVCSFSQREGTIFGVGRDVSSYHQLLEEAAKVKALFLANMSHEIRTPMNGVMGMTSLLLECELSEEAREYAETIRRSGEVLLSIVNDILDLSKLEAQKIVIEEEPFNLRQMIDNIIDLFAEGAERKGVLLTSIVDPSVPRTLKGDSLRIQQVISNLVSNALKFTPIGFIEVRVNSIQRSDGKHELTIAVRDTGMGMKEETLSTLFNRFSQGDLSTTKKFGGTGLGLAISKNLAELMDGELTVKSELGRGSIFTLNLSLGSVNDEYGVRPKLEHLRICVCTRNPNLKAMVSEIFYFRGMKVDAVSYLEDLANRDENPKCYDFILVDVEENDSETFSKMFSLSNAKRDTKTEWIALVPRSTRNPGDLKNWSLIRKPIKQAQILELIAETISSDKKRTIVRALPHLYSVQYRTQEGQIPLILVAEDNSVNQRVVVRMLEKMGCKCDVVANGIEALEAVQRIQYDLVLMDCFMPEMDGYEATKMIRKLKGSAKNIPIIAVTANALQGDDQNCIEAGMNAYLSKPLQIGALTEVLAKWLSSNTSESARKNSKFGLPLLSESVVCELTGFSGIEGRELFLEVIELFSKSSPEVLPLIKRAVDDKASEQILRSAHKLKGMSANIGAIKLSSLCAELEEQGKKRNSSNLELLFTEIEREFSEVQKQIGLELTKGV